MIDSLSAAADTLIYNAKISQLHPIIIPEPVQFAPIAPGWYLVLGLIILLFLFIFYRLFNNYQSKAYRRNSARELLSLKSEIGKTAPAEILQDISTIMKSTAFVSYSKEKAAKLSGIAWQNFLVSTYPSGKNSKEVYGLLEYQYVSETQQNKLSSSDIEKLIDASIKWVRRHRV
jgi:hypothetical protein